MITIDIYKDSLKVDTKKFITSFYILEDKQGIFWETGREQEVKTRLAMAGSRETRVGEIKIWLRAKGDIYPADIPFIGPDWQLVLNDMVMKQGIYLDIYVSGKKVELIYKPYRFVCVFPPFEGDSNLEPKEPYKYFKG